MKIIILTGILSFAVFTVAAQQQARHYTLAECGGDQLLYIEKNYEDNPERYIGQTMGFLLDECQVTPNWCFPYDYIQYEGGSDPREGKVIGVFLEFKKSGGYKYRVKINFRPPYTNTVEYYRRLIDRVDPNNPPLTFWRDNYDNIYMFFLDYVIDNIVVFKDYNGTRIKNYRRPDM